MKLAKLANTTIRTENGWTIVRLYETDIVAFNATHITLCTGGWVTLFTAKRMNQVAQQFGLGFRVNLSGGKRVRGSNNLLHKQRNPSGATMWVTYGNGIKVSLTGKPYTFERTPATPQTPIERMASTDTENA